MDDRVGDRKRGTERERKRERERERGTEREREREGGAHWLHCVKPVGCSVFFTGLLTPHRCSWTQLSALRTSLISDDILVTFVEPLILYDLPGDAHSHSMSSNQ